MKCFVLCAGCVPALIRKPTGGRVAGGTRAAVALVTILVDRTPVPVRSSPGPPVGQPGQERRRAGNERKISWAHRGKAFTAWIEVTLQTGCIQVSFFARCMCISAGSGWMTGTDGHAQSHPTFFTYGVSEQRVRMGPKSMEGWRVSPAFSRMGTWLSVMIIHVPICRTRRELAQPALRM